MLVNYFFLNILLPLLLCQCLPTTHLTGCVTPIKFSYFNNAGKLFTWNFERRLGFERGLKQLNNHCQDIKTYDFKHEHGATVYFSILFSNLDIFDHHERKQHLVWIYYLLNRGFLFIMIYFLNRHFWVKTRIMVPWQAFYK